MLRKKMKHALIIVDIQNDYFEGGKYPLHKSEEAAQKARLVLEKCRQNKIPVIHIQHINPEGAPFFEPNSVGVEIHSLVKPDASEMVVTKHFPNSFFQTNLKSELDKLGVENLFIVGMMTHMCIDTTTRAAKDLGYKCTLIGDCCATRNLEYNGKGVEAEDVQTAYLAGLNGMFAEVINYSDFKID